MILDSAQIQLMKDNILGNNGKVAGPLNTWVHIDTFTNAYRRCYFRVHYFKALEELGINFLEIKI